jgi:hypothetical protein
MDSPLEGTGFELISNGRLVPNPDGTRPRKVRFAVDSPLEQRGFEPLVPLTTGHTIGSLMRRAFRYMLGPRVCGLSAGGSCPPHVLLGIDHPFGRMAPGSVTKIMPGLI